jgi:hypothetical protein
MEALMTKDELVVDIAREIASAPRLSPDWESLAVVFSIESGHSSNFGYCYTGPGDDDWAAFSIGSRQIDSDLRRLREVMRQETGSEWRQALFQIVRTTGELSFNFAYDETRWKVIPANLHSMIAMLRPGS